MTPRVAVLIGVYNGADYLAAQLQSLAEQSLPPAQILLSDDGSTDGSARIVAEFAKGFPGQVTQLAGPQSGLAANYLHLLAACPDCDMVALSDQDDVWLPQKLAHQWQRLEGHKGPAFHGATTWRTDADLGQRRASGFRRVTPGLPHALVQNLAGANTMALNRAGLALAQKAAARLAAQTRQVAYHDWWLYQLFAAAGATILYEDHPQVLYRQHGGNEIGDNQGARAAWGRLSLLFEARYQGWIDANLAALEAAWDLCTPEAQRQIRAFQALRAAPLLRRLAGVARLGLRRDGAVGQGVLWLAALTGRL